MNENVIKRRQNKIAASRKTSNISLINYEIESFWNLIFEQMLVTLIFAEIAEVQSEGSPLFTSWRPSNFVWLSVFSVRLIRRHYY